MSLREIAKCGSSSKLLASSSESMIGVCPYVKPRKSLHTAVFTAFTGGALLLTVVESAQAAYGYNGYQPAYQARQNHWRPTPQAPRVATEYRWRPVAADTRAVQQGGWRGGRVARRPAPLQRWTRSARPVSRASDLVSQFRPDRRYDEGEGKGRSGPGNAADADLHAQFRPLAPPVRRTYEQLYRAEPEPVVPRQPMMPVAPYPATPYMPPPMPMAPYWRYW